MHPFDSSRAYYVGAQSHPMYVEERRPPSSAGKLPIVLIHGGAHCGLCYCATPDGRPGWTPYFSAHGYPTCVVDWPGHGRSPMPENFATMSTREVVAAVLALIERIGRCILLTHSMGGPIGWSIAEQARERIAAIIGIAPGPPANLQPALPEPPAPQVFPPDAVKFGDPRYCPEDRSARFDAANIRHYWANSAKFPAAAFADYCRGIFPESARAVNERYNFAGRGLVIAGPEAVAGIPIAVVTGDQDTRHPCETDAAVANYLNAEFIWLPDHKLIGHGHMMMIELDNLKIADLLLGWLARHGL